MTKFICKTEEFLESSVDPLDPPEYGCLYEEIEAPNRNKAKWIFIKNNFGTRGSMKSRGLPKISVTIAKPFLVIEQDPNAELEPYLIDGETYDPICMMKFDSLERISKFSEILHRCGVPHSKECLTYLDTSDNKPSLSKDDEIERLQLENNKLTQEIEQAKIAASKLYTEQSQKIFDLESRIAGLVNREKLASHAANQFEQENRQLKSEIRVEIAELLDKESKNAEENSALQKEIDSKNSQITALEDLLMVESLKNRESKEQLDDWAEERGLLKLRTAQIVELEQSIKNIVEQLDELKNALAVKETNNQLLQSQLTQAQNELYYLNSRFRMSLA